MDPVTGIALLTALLAGAKELIPQIKDWVESGDVTPEEQQKLMAEYESLKKKADGQFSGPEWDKSGR